MFLPNEANAATTATSKRDVSPCGGVLKGDIRVE